MKDLIRKILLEYLNPELLLEGKATVVVPPKMDSEIESYTNKVNKGGSGFRGYFFNLSDQVGTRFFLLETTKHYKQRTLRTEEPEYKPNGKLYDPKIVNPEPLEGIQLISTNINYIAELIYEGKINTEKEFITFFTRESVPYSVIVFFSRDPTAPKKIVMKLITQIKGVRFSRRYTDITPQKNIELFREDKTRMGSISRRLIERILKKLGLII
jgi:hypothetical protein